MKKHVLLCIGISINLFIWINSLLSGDVSSNQSGFVVETLYPLFKNVMDVGVFTLLIRKGAHFTEFMILSIVFNYYYRMLDLNKYHLITFIHGLGVAIIDETIQTFIPGRSGNLVDVLIDTCGVIVGILLVYVIDKIRRKR